MDRYFVRVYHRNDGATTVPNSVYQSYEDAVKAANVDIEWNPKWDYVTIETRYAPVGAYWDGSDKCANSSVEPKWCEGLAIDSRDEKERRLDELTRYLGLLIDLKRNGVANFGEINAVTSELNKLLDLDVKTGGNGPNTTNAVHVSNRD